MLSQVPAVIEPGPLCKKDAETSFYFSRKKALDREGAQCPPVPGVSDSSTLGSEVHQLYYNKKFLYIFNF